MKKYPVGPETERKTERLTLIALAIICVLSLIFAFFGNQIAAVFFPENNAKQLAGDTTNAENIDVGDIDHPAGATFECELTFLDMDRRNITDLNPTLPDHPTNPDSNKLQADTEYIVQLNFPDMLRAEIENDNYNFDVSAKYEFEVKDNYRAHFQVKLYNRDTGNLYVANGAVLAADNLCLKHSFGKSSNYISRWIEFEKDYFAFSVYTSALPDAGPKSTTDASYGGWGYSLHYTIAGMTADEWIIPYE